jgi:Fe2+ or Zn2+ uptake regulation protein
MTRAAEHASAGGHDHAHGRPPDDALRASGRRVTVQRAAIWEALTDVPGMHLDADAVARRVRKRLPQVNESTVYRTLDVLVEDGLVTRTDLGADRAFFEPTHEHPHHHLVCERCGSVSHVHDDAFGDLRRLLAADGRFVPGDREITVFGTCRACLVAAALQAAETIEEKETR